MGRPVAGPRDYLALGDWNAACDVCGFKFKASELSSRWDGMKCCAKCWDPRHPQDFVRGVPEQQTPPWTRPRGEDVMAAVCSPSTSSAIPGSAGPGCAKPGWVSPFYF